MLYHMRARKKSRFRLPMRDGNLDFMAIAALVVGFRLPMRDGNLYRLSSGKTQARVLDYL